MLLAFSILTAALLGLLADRHLGAHVFDPANGGVILWRHLFWFFGHPEVYIVALPFFGIVYEIFPVFSRKPIFGYKGLVWATLAIAALSVAVWAHHMYATGAVLLPFFSFMTFLIAVPTGVKFFNWIGTMWKGQLSFETPMIFSVGFLVTFLFGGLTGILLAAPAIDFQVSDSYFVVAHFHYVLYGRIGAYVLGASTLPFIWNIFKSYRYGEVAAQLHRTAPNPLRTARLRAALPAHDGDDAPGRPRHLHRQTPAARTGRADAVTTGHRRAYPGRSRPGQRGRAMTRPTVQGSAGTPSQRCVAPTYCRYGRPNWSTR
ncbi:Cytochrome C and Quinol oxidase polypeptide I [Amycolatopsis marina]|uniref:Cytochrome C and Quinol oxidase polypeptide I n=1 Tax=Amycolatopsis marina TaxID=490629 RepID=A0A1I1CJE8_9PSEU|nr:Cytochrome C and Quinol oxidase polypeptide I [Amycolatopsis marina]